MKMARKSHQHQSYLVVNTSHLLVICILFISLITSPIQAASTIVKRQTESAAHNENEQELCKGRPPSEYFRLTADDDCRDVVRCSVQGLLALRCPSGLAFDIEKQTCDWKSNVKNCAQLESECPFHYYFFCVREQGRQTK